MRIYACVRVCIVGCAGLGMAAHSNSAFSRQVATFLIQAYPDTCVPSHPFSPTHRTPAEESGLIVACPYPAVDRCTRFDQVRAILHSLIRLVQHNNDRLE